jgi:hypothetical protein
MISTRIVSFSHAHRVVGEVDITVIALVVVSYAEHGSVNRSEPTKE